MSGLATVLAARGAAVSGSDLCENHETAVLRMQGAQIHRGHNANMITGDLDRVIVSSAIPADHEEVMEARRHKIPVVPRLRVVAELLEQHRSIGVAGTHGKTTTTAILASLLAHTGRHPSYLIGADCPSLGGNARWDRGDWFVAEVDESDGLLVEVASEVAVLTNIGKDHLQTYQDIESIERVFFQYLQKSRQQVLCVDDPRVARLSKRFPACRTVGVDRRAEFSARNIVYDRWTTGFDLYQRERLVVRNVTLPAPGKHNVRNALCALVAAQLAGVSLAEATQSLCEFRLPRRRFELLEENGVTVVDDYAHLPEEIEATLAAIRTGWPGRRIIAVFQPHRFSRTQLIGDEFGAAFSEADVVLVTPIYAACEQEIPGVSSSRVAIAVRCQTQCAVLETRGMDDAVSHLEAAIRPGDFIISFGAGDVWQITDRLAQILTDGHFLQHELSHQH